MAANKSTNSTFKPEETQFRQKEIKAEDAQKGRYILYVAKPCPWAARALVGRSLKHLEEFIDVSIVDPINADRGWTWTGYADTDKADPVNGYQKLKEVYLAEKPDYDGRFSVPVLYDKVKKRIVNNESADILRLFNAWPIDKHGPDLYPSELRSQIDEINEWILEGINLGVYKAGFATKQADYTENVNALFEALDRVEALLAADGGKRDFLIGPGKGVLTEADVRLYTTLARFDCAYHPLFRCNKRRLRDYPYTHRFFVSLYNQDAFKKWTDFEQIKTGYSALVKRNKDEEFITPVGPLLEDIL